jgi:hypothetical protein
LERFLAYPLGPSAETYLANRGLLEVASDLRFGSVPDSPERREHYRFAGRLIIPSFSARGLVTDLAFRCIEDHRCEDTVLWVDEKGKDRTCSKYLFVKGLEKRLYHVESVTTTASTIHITEGQLDAATLVACGLPAVGVPGAKAWKDHCHRLFQGFDRVVFWADQDDKGQSLGLFERIRQGVSAAEVMMVADGQDVNSFYVEHGREGILALLEDKPEDADDGDDDGAELEPEEWSPPEAGEGQAGPAGVVHYDDEGRVIPF